jgi:GT2 family glycosyltransferase
MYGEEIDLSYRLLDRGYKILYAPQVQVDHYQSQSGRPQQGAAYWRLNALNKSRMAWRLLPLPYPLTTTLIWGLAAAYRTRRPGLAGIIWRQLWAEREALRQERRPIQPETAQYIQHIGGRLLY